jgi:hypothetical protein
MENGRINADADLVIASLDPSKGRPAGEGAVCHNGRWQLPTAAGIPDVGSELLQGAANRQRRTMGRWHMCNLGFPL